MTKLIISIDTEVSGSILNIDTPDRQFYGKIDGGRELGVNYIMDTLSFYGWKCTFFISVFDSYKWGEEILEGLVRNIVDRGFDVQLHTHIEFDNKWKKSFLKNYDLDKQVQFICKGKELLTKWSGKTPLWHRAGHLAADNNTLEACRNLGLNDSSYAYGWSTCEDLKKDPIFRNTLDYTNGIYELPLTTFRTISGLNHFRVLDINNCVLAELVSVIDQAIAEEAEYIVLLMHSFSFVRRKSNKYISRSREVNRFERLLKYCQNKKEIEVCGYESIIFSSKASNESFDPVSGFLPTYLNAFINIQKGRVNWFIVLFPFILIIVAKLRTKFNK